MSSYWQVPVKMNSWPFVPPFPNLNVTQLSESLPSLLALQFSLTPMYTLLWFIDYTYQDIWRYRTLTSCSVSTQTCCFKSKLICTGVNHRRLPSGRVQTPPLTKLQPHLHLFIFSIVPCSYESRDWTVVQ